MIDVALHKYLDAEGTRRVRAVAAESAEGRRSITLVRVAERFAAGRFTLLDVTIKTGRTHQIRVHLADAGHVVVGDPKYGDFALNKALARGMRLPAPASSACSCMRGGFRSCIPRAARRVDARSAVARRLRPVAAGAPADGSHDRDAPLRPDRLRLGRHPVRLDPR